jgi:ribonuclease J
MASMTFYGGIREIGGNKFLIEDRKTRVFLDFGQSFSLLDDYFVAWLQPRGRFGLKDYFALDLMPKTKGLYNRDSLERTGIQYSEPGFDAVFVTHAHYDHTQHLQYLDPGIPIYMGETCKAILDSVMETTGAFFFSEQEWKKRDGTVMAPNTVRTFRTGDKIKIDTIEVTPIHVDHSVPGAYGFVVDTSEGTLVYSGDLRKHGPMAQMTKEFVDKSKDVKPEALIIEGTRVTPQEKRKNHSEQIVQTESLKLCKASDKLVLAMRYPKDLDRFRTFYTIAKETERTLVISLKTAHLLFSLLADRSLGLPDPRKDPNIEVYMREMKTYKSWEKPMLERCVDCEWVRKNQKSVIWELDFSQLQELIDVEPEPGGVCIHSMSEPFDEDPTSQLQDDVLRNWLDRFSMSHHQLHASGHASQKEIFEMCAEIGAKKTIPVHTQNPEMFKEGVKGAVIVEKGESKPI